MLETPLLDSASKQVDAVGDTPVSITGTISKAAIAKAADAVKAAFTHCTGDGCFDHTYTAPDHNYIYYLPLPGYGNIDYTKYVITLAGDPTASMKLTVLADTGKVSVSGPCTSTFTINGGSITTAQDLLRLEIIDSVIPEPVGGAHRNADATILAVGDALETALRSLLALDGPALKAQRRAKFLAMGRKGL